MERVRVLFFGAAADRVRTREAEFAVGDGSDLAELWQLLTDRYPELSPMGNNLAFAVNQEYARMDAPVSPGDEVAVLPPVSGG